MNFDFKNRSFRDIALICLSTIIVFAYVFDTKIDLNGDNVNYYMFAKSIEAGKGYRNLNIKGEPLTNAWPPGYPVLMTPVLKFVPEGSHITALKIENGVFLMITLIFLYLIVVKLTDSRNFALTAVLIILCNYHLLRFSRILMSEISFTMVSIFAFYLMSKVEELKKPLKDYRFYLFIFLLAYGYLIRTQGITLFGAVFLFLLYKKRWKLLGFVSGGFFLLGLPWQLRNSIHGMGQSRYLSQIMKVNPWRPEDGTISLGDFFERYIDNTFYYISKSIPDAIFPYFDVDYKSTSVGQWVIALIILTLIGYAIYRLREKLGLVFGFYILTTLGLLGLWNAPSGSRYFVTLIPILSLLFFYGLYMAISMLRQSSKKQFNPIILLVFVLFTLPKLNVLNSQAKLNFHPAYANYFKLAEWVKKNAKKDAIVCCRKPTLFYSYSEGKTTRNIYTKDDQKLIKNLIDQNVDYVVLEQLGYSSTALYLYPAVQKNGELFSVAKSYANPDTYLLKFHREKAIEKFKLK